MIATDNGLALVKLADSERACRDCGVVVSKGRDPRAEILEMQSHARQERNPYGDVWARPIEAVFEASRCRICRTRHAIAERLVDEHPFVRRGTGSRKYVVSLVDAALMAVDALGMSMERGLKIASTDLRLRRMIETLPAAGSRATWAARFSPLRLVGADPETAAAARWSHVTPEQQQALRDAFSRLLGLLNDVAQNFPPPEDGAPGCLLCGVGEFKSLRSAAYAGGVWVGPFEAVTRTLGGEGRPDPVHGYLCRTCATSVEKAGGALGASALEQALIDFVGVPVDPALEARLVGLTAWCALPGNPPPNERPWAHVDLAEAADLLRSI